MKVKAVVLKCVSCKAKEVRPAMPVEMPFCAKCGMPMLLEKVSVDRG